MTNVNPVPPVPPTKLSVQSLVTYLGSLAIFILGVLTASGVTVPAGVSTDVQLIAGSIGTVVGALVPLVALLSAHSVTKTVLKAGLPLESVRI